MKSKYLILLFAIFILVGCKPTEKNYKAAYDAAVAKREKSNTEAMLAADGLISDDGPVKKVIAGESLYVVEERTVALDKEHKVRAYSVAVAEFKMQTNARSGAEYLISKGYDALVAKAIGDRYYVLAGSFDNQEEARDCYLRFVKEFPDYSYIGLPSSPVIVR